MTHMLVWFLICIGYVLLYGIASFFKRFRRFADGLVLSACGVPLVFAVGFSIPTGVDYFTARSMISDLKGQGYRVTYATGLGRSADVQIGNIRYTCGLEKVSGEWYITDKNDCEREQINPKKKISPEELVK